MKNESLLFCARRLTLVVALICFHVAAHAQDLAFQLNPSRTTVTFTLGSVLHTVHGTFGLKQGELRLNPAANNLSGSIVVDARSGETGNGMRDRKMHREVLESERYPEILFRPDRVEGLLAQSGKSSVKIHGIFSIHGAEHEITVPAEVNVNANDWSATIHFSVPYVNWGMKNPSTMFLKVSESVDIDVAASGTLSRQ